MIKNVLKILAIFFIGAVGGVFVSQALYSYSAGKISYVTETKQVFIQENTALSDAVEKTKKAVMAVRTKSKNGVFLEGSGIILTSDGLAITLSDITPIAGKFSFFVEEELVSGQILKRDVSLGLSLVKIEKNKLATCGFADLEKIKLGERVFLIGNVFRKEKPVLAVNEGLIKTFDQEMIESNIIENEAGKGSVLFNINGEIIGLNKMGKDGNLITIPISKIKSFVGL